MRININNTAHIDKVSELCELMGCSPTQLIINLINNEHQQYAQGCNQDDKQETNDKDSIH